MTEYCRLCAELKDPSEIVTLIDDVEQSMEQKLWTCCQWTAENTEHRLPHSVCSICSDKLDKCFLFAQSVQLAQQRLLELFVNETEIETKPLVTVIIPPTYDDLLTYSNVNTPSATIPFETLTPEFHYSEYHPIDGDANGQLEEFNDLNDDDHTYSDYFEENKNDIISIQTEDNANDIPKIAQVETCHEHKCTDCGQQFSSKSSLKRHYGIHTGVQPYECWLCHKMFRLKFYLSKHMLIHRFTQDKRIEYGSLNRWKRAKRILSRQNSKNTNRIKCNPRDYRFCCNKCGHLFSKKSQLTKHRMTHTTERPYQCECGQRYKDKSNLVSHQKRFNHSIGDANGIVDEHERLDVRNSLDYKLSALLSMILTGEEQDKEVDKEPSIGTVSNGSGQCLPFQCEECGKGFTLWRGLTKHRRLVHTLENPIKCEHCGKFFKHAHSLRRHWQLFSIEFPRESDTNRFSCEDCDRTFVRKSWLLKHRQSHSRTTAELPHNTATHGLCLKNEYNLDEHPLKQSNEMNESIESQFECWLCHKMFAGISFLKKHFATHILSPEARRLQTELIYHHC